METEEYSTYLQLTYAGPGEFAQIVDSLVKQPTDLHPDNMSLIRTRILGSSYIISSDLQVRLIIKTRDLELYEDSAFQASLNFDTYALTALLKAGIPDPDLENRLVKLLYEAFKHEDWVRTISILKTLRDQGSESSIRILRVLEHDFHSQFQVAKLKSKIGSQIPRPGDNNFNFGQYADHINNEVNLKVGGLIADAIASVTARGDRPYQEEEE